jgi:hypothetical protein
MKMELFFHLVLWSENQSKYRGSVKTVISARSSPMLSYAMVYKQETSQTKEL